RSRVVTLSLSGVREQVTHVARDYGLDAALVDRVVPAEPQGDEQPDDLPLPLRVQVGLLTLVTREREAYLNHFEQRTISRRLSALLVAGADRLADRVRSEGAAGYAQAGAEAVRMRRP